LWWKWGVYDTIMQEVNIMKNAMQRKREDMKKEFLSLTPLDRIKRMNMVFNDIISLMSKTEGVKEYEVYRRYLKARR